MIGSGSLDNDRDVVIETNGSGFANGMHQQPSFTRYVREDTNKCYQVDMVGTEIMGHLEATRENRTFGSDYSKATNSSQTRIIDLQIKEQVLQVQVW